jgi:DMSO/TMAO reductase YedYZ molybdopterin-dependent catalytic subunit
MEKGILLKDLITLVKPSADVTTVALICTDGKEYDVSMADAQNYNIMLVHWVAGTVLDNKTGGPVKVAYPADATNYTNDAWAWWVVKVEFK